MPGVIGPYFFEDERVNATTVMSERYVDMLRTFGAEQLQNFPGLHNPWFQQDGAMAYTVRASMAAARQLLGNHIISRFGDIHWPPRSPDLSVCDFFLWDHLKSKVYTIRPMTILEFKTRIQERISCNSHGSVSKCHAESQRSLPGMHTFEWPSSYGHCF
jgi:hypothetical protein